MAIRSRSSRRNSRSAGGVVAGRDHAIGAADVARFEPRFDRQREPRDAALVSCLIGEHALDRGDVHHAPLGAKTPSRSNPTTASACIDRSFLRIRMLKPRRETFGGRAMMSTSWPSATIASRSPEMPTQVPLPSATGRGRPGHENQPRHEVCIE